MPACAPFEQVGRPPWVCRPWARQALPLLQPCRRAQCCASFPRRTLHLPLLQADLYTFFREIYSLWVALGQYAGEPLRVMPVSAACCAGRAAPLPPPPRRSAPAGWACLPAMPHQRGFPAKSVGRQAFHSCPLAIRPCAELRVEDVLAEVEDLLRAPDPQRITLPGRPRQRAITACGMRICARTAASRDCGPPASFAAG